MSSPLLPNVWKVWSSITSTVLSSASDFSSSPVSLSSYNCNNSYFKLSLDITNRKFYQKGLNKLEIRLSSPQILTGTVVLIIVKPVIIKDMTVQFYGLKHETIFELSNIKNTDKFLKEGKKRIDFKTLIDEKCVWSHQIDEKVPIGIYTYPFNFMVDPLLPESIRTSYLNISYNIEVMLKYDLGKNNFKTSRESLEIKLIRCLSDNSTISIDPVIATGNWRDILIYEFNLQNKIAFQGLSYQVSIFLYPFQKNAKFFKLHNISIYLIQQLKFDIVEFNNTRPITNSYLTRHTETHKILLLKKEIGPEDMVESNGCYQFNNFITFPSINSFHNDLNKTNNKSKKIIHPYVNNESNQGFASSHILKVCFELSECKTANNESRRSSTSTENSTDISSSTKSSTNLNVPPYSAYHQRRNEVNKYKKVELSFSTPIILLTSQSFNGSTSLPLYSHISDYSIDNTLNINNLRNFDKLEDKNQIIPPHYGSL